MQINVFVLGSGRAARALVESLKIVEVICTTVSVASIRTLARGESLKGVTRGVANPVLFIANPHGLHAQAILDAEAEGFELIICEKPAAVSRTEVEALRHVQTPVAICHGYRQTWGVQTLRAQIEAGDFGQIIAIEGRYWQSSAAKASLSADKKANWKNDPALGGTADALIDISTHWLDAAFFLLGEHVPLEKNIGLSYVNAEATHRDTHVNLNFRFGSGARVFASVSKTVHGASNHFEINVIGSKRYAAWRFMEPDVIEVGLGSEKRIVSRRTDEVFGSGHPPHHGTGWLEGYIEILKIALGADSGVYPTLTEHLNVLDVVLT